MELKLRTTVLLMLLSLASSGKVDGDRAKAQRSGAKNMGYSKVDEVDMNVKIGREERELFSEKWLTIFSDEQLKTQPKWRLSDAQPEDGSYQVRVYDSQWWLSSFTPCLGQTIALSSGYMNLYFYLNGFNYQRFKYPLTYPIVLHVDKRPQQVDNVDDDGSDEYRTKRAAKGTKRRGKGNKPGNGKRRNRGKKQPKVPKVCPTRYTTSIFLPITSEKRIAHTENDKIIASRAPQETYYVREYFGNYTAEYCNEQFQVLIRSLITNNIWVDPDSWYCARYDPGAKHSEPRYEVWMKERLE